MNAGPAIALFLVFTVGFWGPPLYGIVRDRLRMRWGTWKRTRQKRRAERAQLQALADMLHFSDAWHCGCWFCDAERRANHGDVPKGKHIERGTLFGIPYVVVRKRPQ